MCQADLATWVFVSTPGGSTTFDLTSFRQLIFGSTGFTGTDRRVLSFQLFRLHLLYGTDAHAGDDGHQGVPMQDEPPPAPAPPPPPAPAPARGAAKRKGPAPPLANMQPPSKKAGLSGDGAPTEPTTQHQVLISQEVHAAQQSKLSTAQRYQKRRQLEQQRSAVEVVGGGGERSGKNDTPAAPSAPAGCASVRDGYKLLDSSDNDQLFPTALVVVKQHPSLTGTVGEFVARKKYGWFEIKGPDAFVFRVRRSRKFFIPL